LLQAEAYVLPVALRVAPAVAYVPRAALHAVPVEACAPGHAEPEAAFADAQLARLVLVPDDWAVLLGDCSAPVVPQDDWPADELAQVDLADSVVPVADDSAGPPDDCSAPVVPQDDWPADELAQVDLADSAVPVLDGSAVPPDDSPRDDPLAVARTADDHSFEVLHQAGSPH
jgi:hypothetical protein